MSFDEFCATLANPQATPPALSAGLCALWLDARGDWSGAHRAVQDDGSRDSAWVHAFLHRKEGDIGNAGYWYLRAGRPMPETTVDLETEWEEITRALLRA